MNTILKKIADRFKIDIDAPYSLRIGDEDHVFQCVIRGYGCQNGMICDKDWNKIKPVADILIEMGFGYSCIDIEADEEIDSF